jgi:hypothetical protein
VKSKKFIKCCEKVFKVLFEFEFKWFELKRILKGKAKKKENLIPLPFGPAAHQPTLAPLAAARIPLSSFLFPQSLTPEPHLSAPLLLPTSVPFPLLRSIVRRRNHRRARPPPSSSPPTRANQLRHVESVSQFFFHCGRNIILNG